MKSTIYITPKYRKGIALLLLFYFIVSPLLFAFPIDECNGVCEITEEIHTCSTMDLEVNCCEMMEMHEYNSNSCEMEFNVNTCAIVNDVVSSNNFVVTQKFQSEQGFVIISTLDQYSKDYKFLLSENSHIFISEKSPPIYISVQSFLN